MLLAERGDLEELRTRADAGDVDAALLLARLLAERGDLEELRARADAGDGRRLAAGSACWPSAATWTGHADTAGPGRRRRRCRLPGGWPNCWPTAGTWSELRALADAGNEGAAGQLARLLAERGDLDGELRARADAGDRDAAVRLAELLAKRGDLDEGCAPGPTPATATPPGSWPGCWPSAATWRSCAPGPTPATRAPPSAGQDC